MLAVRFSSKVQNITDWILQKIQIKGNMFNGLHLRMEDDMADAVQGEGGFMAAKQQYENAFKKLQYHNCSLLYVASGIFTDRASGMNSVLSDQVRKQHACHEKTIAKRWCLSFWPSQND